MNCSLIKDSPTACELLYYAYTNMLILYKTIYISINQEFRSRSKLVVNWADL